MTTSSRDMYSVRLGLFANNAEALAESDYEHLATSNMSGAEIDQFIIEDIYNKEMEYYADNPEGQQLARDNKRENLRKVNQL